MDAEKLGFLLGTEFLEPYAPVGEKEFLTQCEPSTYCHNQASLLRVLGFLLRLGLPFSLSLPSLQTARFHTKSGRKLTKNLGGGALFPWQLCASEGEAQEAYAMWGGQSIGSLVCVLDGCKFVSRQLV